MVCVDLMSKTRKEGSKMESWKHDKFKNQIQYKSGYTWSKEQELRKLEPHSVRVLTVSNVQDKLDLEEELYLKDVSEKDKKEKAVSKNWCIAVSSNGNRKRIGNAVFIKDDTDYLFASFLTAFRPKDNSDILPEYFFLWFSSYPVQERLSSVSEGTTGLGNLNIRYLRNLDIVFPQEQEQQSIVNILSKVDEAIASVQNSIATAERLKKSLMQNLLTGKMKPDGTFRTPEEFYIDEKFGKVPLSWEVKRIDEVFDFYPTASYSRSMLLDEGDCKYIHYGDIHTRFDTFLDISKETLPYINKDMVKKFVYLEDGDIIISDTSEDYEGVGKLVEIINLGDSRVISGLHTLLLRLKTDELINGFKGYLFNEERVRLEFLKFVTGIKVYSISKNSLAKVLIPIPPRGEQIQIKNKLDSFYKELCNSKDKIKSLERLKKSLMQNLLTGKVKIGIFYV